jgi:hypothetical protein
VHFPCRCQFHGSVLPYVERMLSSSSMKWPAAAASWPSMSSRAELSLWRWLLDFPVKAPVQVHAQVQSSRACTQCWRKFCTTSPEMNLPKRDFVSLGCLTPEPRMCRPTRSRSPFIPANPSEAPLHRRRGLPAFPAGNHASRTSAVYRELYVLLQRQGVEDFF